MPSSIDILVPGARAVIGDWYDETPAAAIDGMPPHLTLLWPWVEDVSDDALHRLRAAVAGIAPFTIRLSTTGRFPGVLFLEPRPVAPVLELSRAIWHAFPEAPPYGGELSHEPVPHLTVAKGDELDDAEQTVSERLGDPLVVEVGEINVSQAGAGSDGRWGVVAVIGLGG